MKISDIDKLQVGDSFEYHGHLATIICKREKDVRLALGSEDTDKSICLTFDIGKSNTVTLVSRLDSKMVKDGCLYELDLEEYQPYKSK